MKIVSLSINYHDSSFSIIENGNIIECIQSERKTGIKKSNIISSFFIEYFSNKKDTYDFLVIDIFDKFSNHDSYRHQVYDINKFLLEYSYKFKKIKINHCNHHILHAHTGVYTSTFDNALCFVMDGNGSILYNPDISEIESIFLFENKKFKKTLHKRYFYRSKNLKTFNNNNITSEYGIGLEFEKLSVEMGFNWTDAGKVMGLSQYKNNKKKLQFPYTTKEWEKNVDKSYELQIKLQNRVCELIKIYSEKTGIENIVLSGGVFLNCVSNFNCIEKFPHLKFHIDPICSDKGTSLGSCLFEYYKKTKEIPNTISNVYLGTGETEINYNRYNHTKVSYEEVVDLLMKKNIVAIFQGKSEIGERALGNRSLLFDPRVKNGSNIVNKIKKRENFRPFAATVLFEHVKDWFDIKYLNESKYMSYAVNVNDICIQKAPSIVHVNNTCRIQTVTEEQNYHFYNLILEFYKKTNVPMLMNTSFNIAGYPLVETFEQAIWSLNNSEIEYLYLPEKDVLIKIDN